MIKKKIRSLLYKMGLTNNSLFFKENIYSKKMNKRILLLHKIDPFIYNLSGDFSHVNNFEIEKISEVFDELGYIVDILDRDHKSFKPIKKYDIFLGIAAGDSGSEFSRISKLIKDKNKTSLIIPLCFGPEPQLSNSKTIIRYNNFTKRNGISTIDFGDMMRVIKKVDFDDVLKLTDVIFAIGSGDKKEFGYNSYLNFNKKVYNYKPGIYFPKKTNKLDNNLNKFICLAGNGFIVKGIDVIIEAFIKMPQFSLTIYGPNSDNLFNEVYGKIIQQYNNINYDGFIDITSSKFRKICDEHTFSILASCSEGMCTSLMTTIGFGLIPVYTHETSVQIKDYPYIIDETNDDKILIDSIIKMCKEVVKVKKSERERIQNKLKGFIESYHYTNFKDNFKHNFKNFLNEN